MNPIRFAVAVSGGLACLMLGLLVGVSAGGTQTGHVFSVETVTTTAHSPLRAAVDRTVTRTVTDPVTVTRTRTIARPSPTGGVGHPGHEHGRGHGHGGDHP